MDITSNTEPVDRRATVQPLAAAKPLTQDEPTKTNAPIYGFIYPVFDFCVRMAKFASAVEWLKRWFIYFSGAETSSDRRRVGNHAIDIYILAKFGVVVSALIFDAKSWAAVTLASYLIADNLRTYFWYHLWSVDVSADVDPLRERRRFLNLGLAILFSIVAYTYLYSVVIPEQFRWPNGIDIKASAFAFSVGNSFTGRTGDVVPLTDLASNLCWLQLLSGWLCVGVLVANSIPKVKN